MEITYLYGTKVNDSLNTPSFSLVAEEVCIYDFNKFSDIVRAVLLTEPHYSLPAETAKTMKNVRPYGGILKFETNLVRAEFYGTEDSEILSNPSIYFASEDGFEDIFNVAFMVWARSAAYKQDRTILHKDRYNFLGFHSHPADGLKILEEIANEFDVPYGAIDPESQRKVFEKTGHYQQRRQDLKTIHRSVSGSIL